MSRGRKTLGRMLRRWERRKRRRYFRYDPKSVVIMFNGVTFTGVESITWSRTSKHSLSV